MAAKSYSVFFANISIHHVVDSGSAGRVHYFYQRVKLKRRLIQRIDESGAWVGFVHEQSEDWPLSAGRQPPGPWVLRRLFGDDAFYEIESVGFDLREDQIPFELFRDVLAQPNLRHLSLTGQDVTDDWVAIISRTRIETLALVDPKLSANGLDSLAGMDSLRSLELWGNLVDRHLEILPQLQNLERLHLEFKGAEVTSEGLSRLNGCKNLGSLRHSLSRPEILIGDDF